MNAHKHILPVEKRIFILSEAQTPQVFYADSVFPELLSVTFALSGTQRLCVTSEGEESQATIQRLQFTVYVHNLL